MLHQESRVYIFVCLIILLFVSSCKDKYKKHNPKEILEIRENCKSASISIIGEDGYWTLYDNAKDSINTWVENNLRSFNLQKNNSWILDSVVCVNGKGDKCVLSILNQMQPDGNAYSESIWYLYGVKIKNIWYFFDGPGLTLPREFYQRDIYIPLSFEKMKQIATDHIYRGYLKKDKKNKEWVINDNFFWDLTSVAWCSNCNTQEDWDRRYLEIIQDNWQQK